MNNKLAEVPVLKEISSSAWELELEKSSSRYHLVAAWVAIIFDPLFAVTDYFNIPENWGHVFILRLCVAAITFTAVIFRRHLPSHFLVLIPFTLISLQNAYTYSLIGSEHLLGHNLNYMALLIGAAMFAIWDWQYSVVLILISAGAASFFLTTNPSLEINQFFVKGGLLLIASAFFMMILIRTRHNLTIREIKARIALQLSNEAIRAQNEEIKNQNQEIQAQGEEIRGINENLENLVRSRTAELEKKNKALEEYAFINAHKLRSPVASILGLINLLNKMPSNEENKPVMEHLQVSAEKLDEIVSSITKAIQRGEKK